VRALDASSTAVGVDVERCGRPIVEVRAVIDDLPGRRLVLVRSNALRTGPTITRQAPGQQTQRQRDRGARQERSYVDASAPECHSGHSSLLGAQGSTTSGGERFVQVMGRGVAQRRHVTPAVAHDARGPPARLLLHAGGPVMLFTTVAGTWSRLRHRLAVPAPTGELVAW